MFFLDFCGMYFELLKQITFMKKNTLALFAVGTFAIIAFLSVRKYRQLKKRTADVADEGYETAHDVLFPSNKRATSRVKLGPVLPN
jgi:hypothetical protein